MLLIISGLGLLAISLRPRRTLPRPPAVAGVEDEIAFASSVAGATRSGSSLRRALGDGLAVLPAANVAGISRRLQSGAPMDRLLPDIAAALPTSGRSVAATLALAADDGGAVAPLFDRIAETGRRRLELDRKRRAALAQSRLSASIVGGLPVVASALMLVTGRFGAVFRFGGIATAALVAGACLQLLGLVVIGLILRRGR